MGSSGPEARTRAMAGRERPYLSYLLRLWLVEGDGPVWRASLEAPGHAERHGFATLEALFAYLAAETGDLAADEERMMVTEREADHLVGRPIRPD